MAAGQGFKTFVTGDVLTAADTNGYLMQGVWVFANAAARDAAVTSPQEGNMCFLKDSDTTQYYSGSAWSPVAGASSSSAQVAGKNAILNGDFFINQRGFTSNTTNGTYNFDRWLQQNSGGSFTVTPQVFTPGAAPVATYEGRNYVQGITAAQSAAGDYAIITQRIEDVTRYAGSTVTISFFAKANTGTPKIGVEVQQNFGTGGSPSASVSTPAGFVTLSTAWARYSVTIAVPSISFKTLGTTANTSYLELNLWTSSGATFATRASSIGIQNFTASIWGVQLEYASSATYFTTATGTIPGEFFACQRYYYSIGGDSAYLTVGTGNFSNSTQVELPITFPAKMRTTPTFSKNGLFAFTGPGGTPGTMAGYLAGPQIFNLEVNAGTASTTGYATSLRLENDLTARLKFDAEL
jgi:hypothetical protein